MIKEDIRELIELFESKGIPNRNWVINKLRKIECNLQNINEDRAAEILLKHISKTIEENPEENYKDIEDIKESPEYQTVINAMIEFAKLNCND